MKKAFTLIELLVVIAIIAILAAILFPVFAQAKLAAKKTGDLSNMKQQGLGIQMYLNDSDDQYFAYREYDDNWQDGVAVNDNSGASGAKGDVCPPGQDCYYYAHRHFWDQLLQPYIKNWDLFKDPAYGGAWVNTNPADPHGNGYGGQNSYGTNSFFNYTNSSQKGINASQVVEPADSLLINNEDYYHSLPSFRDRTGTIVTNGLLVGDTTNYDWGGYGDQWENNGKGCDWDPNAYNNLNTAAGMALCIKDQQLFGNIFNIVWADGHAHALAIEKVTYDWVDNGQNKTSIWDPFKAGHK
jgi:prepilin-type N-terminal cleavage/methylation domain-containing protein